MSESALLRPISYSEYLESHAKRIYSYATRPDIDAAKTLLKRLASGKLPNIFKARELSQKVWAGLETPIKAQAAIDLLLDYRHLVKAEIDTGGRPTVQYRMDGGNHRHYLGPQITGGNRPLKRFEERMVRSGPPYELKRTSRAGSGRDVGCIRQNEQGPNCKNTEPAAGDRRRGKRAAETYFLSRGRGQWSGKGSWKNGRSQPLPRGVWLRRSFGAMGSAVKPVLLFVNGSTYRPRYRFFQLSQRVVDKNFAGHWKQSWADATRTSK